MGKTAEIIIHPSVTSTKAANAIAKKLGCFIEMKAKQKFLRLSPINQTNDGPYAA